MNYFLSLATALLLLGCSGQSGDKEKKEAPSTAHKPVKEVKAELPGTEAEPTGLKKTIAPQLQNAETAAADGASLYKKCVSCHGAKGEKVALGKSKVIAEMDVTQLQVAIKGYQNGSYGGSMKALMQGQVKTLSDDQISQLAKYISQL